MTDAGRPARDASAALATLGVALGLLGIGLAFLGYRGATTQATAAERPDTLRAIAPAAPTPSTARGVLPAELDGLGRNANPADHSFASNLAARYGLEGARIAVFGHRKYVLMAARSDEDSASDTYYNVEAGEEARGRLVSTATTTIGEHVEIHCGLISARDIQLEGVCTWGTMTGYDGVLVAVGELDVLKLQQVAEAAYASLNS